jgi:hypothetical protein
LARPLPGGGISSGDLGWIDKSVLFGHPPWGE